MPPAKHSDALPLIASTRIATRPVERLDPLARGVHQARIGEELQLRRRSRVFITPSVCRSRRKWPDIPISIAASPPGLPRRSMMIPSDGAQLVHRALKLRVYGRHPHVEPDHADEGTGRRGQLLLLDPHVHRWQVANRDWVPLFDVPRERHRDRGAVTVLQREFNPGSGGAAKVHLRDPPRLDLPVPVASGPGSGSARSRSARSGSRPCEPPSRMDERGRGRVNSGDDGIGHE